MQGVKALPTKKPPFAEKPDGHVNQPDDDDDSDDEEDEDEDSPFAEPDAGALVTVQGRGVKQISHSLVPGSRLIYVQAEQAISVAGLLLASPPGDGGGESRISI